eukprot:362776-Chlamydomonas_euryale.AAC.6
MCLSTVRSDATRAPGDVPIAAAALQGSLIATRRRYQRGKKGVEEPRGRVRVAGALRGERRAAGRERRLRNTTRATADAARPAGGRAAAKVNVREPRPKYKRRRADRAWNRGCRAVRVERQRKRSRCAALLTPSAVVALLAALVAFGACDAAAAGRHPRKRQQLSLALRYWRGGASTAAAAEKVTCRRAGATCCKAWARWGVPPTSDEVLLACPPPPNGPVRCRRLSAAAAALPLAEHESELPPSASRSRSSKLDTRASTQLLEPQISGGQKV